MYTETVGDLSIIVDDGGNVIVLNTSKSDDKGNSPTILETTVKNMVLKALDPFDALDIAIRYRIA